MSKQEDIRKEIQDKKEKIVSTRLELTIVERGIANEEDIAEELSDEIATLKREIRELSESEFEVGFQEWKKDGKPAKAMSFHLTEEDVLKVNYIRSLHENAPLDIIFSPTGMGDGVSARIAGKTYDITDYGSW